MFKRAFLLGLKVKSMAILSMFALFGTFAEIIGIGVFYPIFKYVSMDGDVSELIADNSMWEYIFKLLNLLNIELSLVALFIVSFSFIVLRTLLQYKRTIYTTIVSQGIVKKMRNKYFDLYIDAKTSYHDRVSVGDLVNAMTTELGSALYMVIAPIDFSIFIAMGVSYLLVLFLLSWKMTIVAIILLLLIAIVPLFWIKKSKKVGSMLASANSVMSSFLVDRMQSPRLVRLSGTAIVEKEEFNSLTQNQMNHSIENSRLQAKTDSSMEPLIVLASMMYIYIAYIFFNVTVEIIGIYLLVVLRLTPVVKQLLIILQKVQGKMGSYDLVMSRMNDMKSNAEVDVGGMINRGIEGNIFIDNVYYKYNDSKEYSLSDINIRINKGSIAAIVGPSGSGKSTLIDLLPRLRDPESGSITIGSILSDQYKIKSLRNSIAYAPQSPQIFYGTIKNHIMYANKNATDEDVATAAHLAGADEFINNMPDKYESIVGYDGVRLSGGQKQRIDLARVLLQKSPILILDEPTGNLDYESEERFMNTLRMIRRETSVTIIIVTHNISSIVDADLIIVIAKGKVECQGKHNDIVRKSDWYGAAWKKIKSH